MFSSERSFQGDRVPAPLPVSAVAVRQMPIEVSVSVGA
jgi:hypothetical protein